MKKECYLILHDIRSVQNVGAIFRTADAVGVSKIYVTGYTPSPMDRFDRPRKDFIKASLGAEKSVAWESAEVVSLLESFQREGVEIVAVEQSAGSIDYKTFIPDFPTAIILGNEVGGLPEEILKKADTVVEIPMHGEKESLNVSVAAGIILYRVLDRE